MEKRALLFMLAKIAFERKFAGFMDTLTAARQGANALKGGASAAAVPLKTNLKMLGNMRTMMPKTYPAAVADWGKQIEKRRAAP